MSYKCKKCGEFKKSEWCEDCNEIAEHECERTTDRIKDVHFGNYGDFSITIYISFCDECGKVFCVSK